MLAKMAKVSNIYMICVYTYHLDILLFESRSQLELKIASPKESVQGKHHFCTAWARLSIDISFLLGLKAGLCTRC